MVTTPKFKYSSKHNEHIAKLGKSGWTVSDNGYVYDNNGNEVCRIEKPVPETMTIPLKWEISSEQRQVVIICQKLTGRYQKTSNPTRKDSSDGFRSRSNMIGDAPVNYFIEKDTYEVTVTYTVTIATSNTGWVKEFCPNLPTDSKLSFLTEYGDINKYVIEDIITPEEKDLPSEKREVKAPTKEETLNYFYVSATKEFEKYLECQSLQNKKKEAVNSFYTKGDKIVHPHYGQGYIKMMMGSTIAIQFDTIGLKIVDPATVDLQKI